MGASFPELVAPASWCRARRTCRTRADAERHGRDEGVGRGVGVGRGCRARPRTGLVPPRFGWPVPGGEDPGPGGRRGGTSKCARVRPELTLTWPLVRP